MGNKNRKKEREVSVLFLFTVVSSSLVEPCPPSPPMHTHRHTGTHTRTMLASSPLVDPGPRTHDRCTIVAIANTYTLDGFTFCEQASKTHRNWVWIGTCLKHVTSSPAHPPTDQGRGAELGLDTREQNREQTMHTLNRSNAWHAYQVPAICKGKECNSTINPRYC